MSKFSGKTCTIARHEFLKTVKRKEFLFMTIILPLFLAGINFVPALLAGLTSAENQSVGYVDSTKALDFPEEITNGGFAVGPIEAKTSMTRFVGYPDSQKAMQALEAGEISSYLVIPEDFLNTGIIELYSLEKKNYGPKTELSAELSDIVVTSVLKDRVDEAVLKRAKAPFSLKLFNIGESGKASERSISEIRGESALPFITAYLLFISIFSASGYLLRSVSEEKENRIIEVLLSSVTPTELLAGKVLGLGAVGLLQIAIWMSVLVLGMRSLLPQAVNPFLLVLALIYFLFGFLFFASLMAGIGAISGSMQESQQVAGIFTFAAISPMFVMQLLITNPECPLSVFLSLFPMTSPIAMLVRIGATEVPLYQIAASVLILTASVYGVIVFSSRLFKAYLLAYGKRPGVREILRNMRKE